MFGAILCFELRYQLRQPAFYWYLAVFALAGFLFALVFAQPRGAIQVNSPVTVAFALGWLGLLGALVPLWVWGDVALRDAGAGMSELVGTTPTPAWLYLAARFAVAFLGVCLVSVAAAAGYEIACRMWWIDPAKIAPFHPLAYANVLAILVLPTCLTLGAIFALVAAATRSRLATYIALIGIFVFVFTTYAFMPRLAWGNRYLAGLADPTGLAALLDTTAHWTPHERNATLLPLQGTLLWNRAIWGAVSIACLALVVVLLARPDRAGRVRAGSGAARGAPAGQAGVAASRVVPLAFQRRAATPFTGGGLAGQVFACLRLELRATLHSWTVLILLVLFGVATGAVLWSFAQHSVTASVLNMVGPSSAGLLYLLALFLGGEMVWRERQARIAEIVAATPTPSFVFVVTKLGALAVTMAALLGIAAIVGLAFQVAKGAPQIDLHFYAVDLLLSLLPQALMVAVVAMLVHVVVNSRPIGHLVAITLIVGASIGTEWLGSEERLLQFGYLPDLPLSDMNGLGHFLTGRLWFLAYWGCVSILLGVAATMLWVRGPAPGLLARLGGMRHAVTPAAAAVGVLALLGTAFAGGGIYWSTHVLNEWATKSSRELERIAYEKSYGGLVSAAQPNVTEVELAVDLHPETRAYSVRGKYVLANLGTQPIETVVVEFNSSPDRVELAGATLAESGCCDVYVFRPSVPLAPGETRVLEFALSLSPNGFTAEADVTRVLHNGTFMGSHQLTPRIGIDPAGFLQDEARRRAHGLEPLAKAPVLGGEPTRRNYAKADHVRFSITVSTSPDQIAVAPGYLQREWTEGGRRYFRYQMDRAVRNQWAIVSARYVVARDRWKDVELAVYHHPKHARHVPRMLEAMKLALEYCSTQFGPFQHRQMRILEFPYDELVGLLAVSFPNTVPFGEIAGFTADPSALLGFDDITRVTAHEIAHQWWGGQVVPADMPGARFITETLAEYSALMVMERRYGRDMIRGFLKQNLDAYLKGRGGDGSEQPLVRVSARQPHIAYQKGGLAMYALKEAIGEEAVNRALARLVQQFGDKSDIYPTPDDLVRLLRAEAGPRHQELVTDLFERIVLWDYRILSADAKATDDGRWRVQLKVISRKLEADSRGAEKEAPLDQDVEVGLFAADPSTPSLAARDVILLERRRLKGGVATIELVSAQRPAFAGINPYLTLIQRDIGHTIVALPR